jgi:hypothetical protein
MKSGYTYPIETLKHWYVTPIGGLSTDLEPGQIGINRDAIAGNTDLVPYQDRVFLSKLDGERSRPLFARKYFDIVPLDGRCPDALLKSSNGEAVLPQEDILEKKLHIGESVILNGVISQRYPRGYGKDFK